MENEYIRLVAISKGEDGKTNRFVRYVQGFEQYKDFVMKYRAGFDLFNQIATNRGIEDGKKANQWRRRVLFLDFDKKDHPEMKTASDCTTWIHERLEKLFVHCIVDSGHGYHCYVCIPETVKLDDVVTINKLLADVTGADKKAVSPTQICRIPCGFNHKKSAGSDYTDRESGKLVTVINNDYGNSRFRPLDLPYVARMCREYVREQETQIVLQKTVWNYEQLETAPRYLCIRKALEEGVEKGQRNWWQGRIVAMLQMEGYTESAIKKACRDFNMKCRPPKNPEEIDEDTDRYLNGEYKLLGCYEAFRKDDPHRQWVYEMCDKVHCGTYHAGTVVTVEESDPARINRKVLSNKNLRDLSGIHFLILTILDVYGNTYGRRGFRERDLEKLLHSSVAKRQCVSNRRLKVILEELKKMKYLEMKPDSKKPEDYGPQKIRLTRRLREFQQGYIWFYFSIANALIDGKISQTDYRVFLTLVRNLKDRKPVTYEQLADDLNMDPQNIGKSIRKLRDERCLIVRKRYTESGKEYNQYQLTEPKLFEQDDSGEVISLLK